MRQTICLICLWNALSTIAQTDSLSDEQPTAEFDLVYSALPWANLDGGIKTGFVYIDNLDMTAHLHLGKLFTWEHDVILFVYGLGNHGGYATELMGDFQTASNIEADPAWRIYEAWSQYNVFNDRISLLAGLYDLNSEFDVLEPGALLINSSFGIGAELAPTGQNGPSIFPISSLAFRASGVIGNHIQLRLGVFDGVPGDANDASRNNISISQEQGALIIIESSIFRKEEAQYLSKETMRNTEPRHKKVGRENDPHQQDKLNIGGWYYTAPFEAIGSMESYRGNMGIYAGFQKYFGEWSVFTRYGVANDRFNRFGSALSGGLVLANVSKNLNDQVGLAFSTGYSGRRYQDKIANGYTAETAIELTYSIAPFDWLNIQPDLQYVIHPDTRADLSNALAVALLVQISL